MAEGKGILALIGGAPADNDDEEGKEGGGVQPKARALQDMYEAMRAGKFERAALAFQRAYDICKMHSADSGDDGSDEGDGGDEEY